MRRAAASPRNCEHQGQGPPVPGADRAPWCGCGGCRSRSETPSSHSAPDRTGKGRRGRNGAVSHFPLQSKTHTQAPGTPAPRRTQLRGPTRAARASPARGLGRGTGKPPARPAAPEGGTVHTHTPLALLPSPRSSCWPRKSASSRHG